MCCLGRLAVVDGLPELLHRLRCAGDLAAEVDALHAELSAHSEPHVHPTRINRDKEHLILRATHTHIYIHTVLYHRLAKLEHVPIACLCMTCPQASIWSASAGHGGRRNSCQPRANAYNAIEQVSFICAKACT